MGANIQATDNLYFWLNYSLLNSEITDPIASLSNLQGNELQGVPEYTASLGATYQVIPDFAVRLHVDQQGEYFVNESNEGGKFGDYSLVNLGFDLNTEVGEFNFQINNLFDDDYDYVYDFRFGENDPVSTIYSPGDGINFSLTYTAKY